MLKNYIEKQKKWSFNTFGPGNRDIGIINHIKKELDEILESPGDVMEWIDVIILALDGAHRNGFSSDEIVEALEKKQAINFKRTWPDWKKFKYGEPIEHIKTNKGDY